MSKIVIALGGNALGKTPEEQLELVKKTAKVIVDLSENNDVVVSHGNGPQVGMIKLATDYSANNGRETPVIPFAECGAMSEGYIGYHLQQSIKNELLRRNINKKCATVVTQVLVDKDDGAFQNPTKPVGMFYDKLQAEKIAQEKGYSFMEDAGRGYRRVVPSPKPIKIVELDTIKDLVDAGNIVIAGGGGGIPVIFKDNNFVGVDAVIDKDFSSARMAIDLNADMLIILTAVDKVSINFNKENQQELDTLTIEECNKYISKGEFAKGSMLPKIEACMMFVSNCKEKKALITSLLSASDALNGKTGTIIKY